MLSGTQSVVKPSTKFFAKLAKKTQKNIVNPNKSINFAA